MTENELDEWVANLMEKKPDSLAIRLVSNPNDQKYNVSERYSLCGWWVCNTGTDAMDKRGIETPCDWNPRYKIASEPRDIESLGAAMDVFEKCLEKATLATRKGTTGYWVSDCDNKRRFATAETLPLAIAKFAKALFEKGGE